MDQSDASSRQSLEYLLFAPKSGMERDLMHLIEVGFNSGRESGNSDSDTAVCVTNSLGLVPYAAGAPQGSLLPQQTGCRGRVSETLIPIMLKMKYP